MRTLGLFFAWALSAIVAYVLAAIASQQVVLAGVGAYKDVSLSENVQTTLAAIVAQPIGTLYVLVIAVGFLIAFYVADLIKAVLPRLSGIAYPTAGAVAIVVALVLMRAQYDIVPILGAQSTYGFWLQVLAGVIGGVVFEILRPKDRDERAGLRRMGPKRGRARR